MGLLQHAALIAKQNKVCFSDFIIKNKLLVCGIYEEKDNKVFLQNSLCYDRDSIIKSESTKDFWDGLIKEENKIYKFNKSDTAIISFFQFFSESLLEKLNELTAFKKQNQYFLIFNSKLTDKENLSLSNTSNAPKEVKLEAPIYNIYTLDYSEFSSKIENPLEKAAFENELYNRISLFLGPKGIISKSKEKIKMGLPSSIEIPGELFSKHLEVNLLNLMDSKINLEFLGFFDSQEEILNQMKAE